MRERNPEQLERIVGLLDQAVMLLDQQDLDRAAAHLDRCRDEVLRELRLLRTGDS
jgi:hypothetical protein